MKYPIRIVAKQTGLTPATLRMWEMRYETIIPERDKHGRRLYSEELVSRLRLLARLIREGYRISDISHLDITELQRLQSMLVPDYAVHSDHGEGSNVDDLGQAVDAVLRMDVGAIEDIMSRAIASQGALNVVDGLIFPLVSRVEHMVDNGKARHVHLTMLLSALSSLLAVQLPSVSNRDGKHAIAVAGPRGQTYSVGGLASMIHVVEAGWYPIMLGTSVCAEDMAEAVRTTHASALLVASVVSSYDEVLQEELAGLRGMLADDVPILFGGRMPQKLVEDLERSGLKYVNNMNRLRAVLRSLAA